MRYLIAFALFLIHPAPALAGSPSLTTIPSEIERACRGGSAKIYDECGDQLALFQDALAKARRENKVLLVSYGAEWCIWCHVFHDYVTGVSGAFTHTFSDYEDKERYTATLQERAEYDVTDEVEALKSYVAANFVLLHLENRYAPGADEALRAAGIDPYDVNWLPYIFTVNGDGQRAAVLEHDRVEKRRDTADWFRGYVRSELLLVLQEMHDAAKS